MPDLKPHGADRLRQRRWIFAGCVFDESNWTLVVDGRRVAIEIKPLEMLRELLLQAGNVVTKDELLDKIWPDVTVVEASLPTAVHKLRHALGDDRHDRCIIETVPGIGYRLAVPVEGETLEQPPSASSAAVAQRAASPASMVSRVAIAGAVILGATVALYKLGPQQAVAAAPAHRYTQRDAQNALRRLDVGTIENMLAAGWNPNTPFDDQGNGAINYVLNMCEWDRGHNQEQMVLMVRTLIDGGATLDHRNVWGDTPYSIAKAVRYCGPNHPVTRSIRAQCYAGYKPLGDRCLASYELDRPVSRRKS
jgi:DNA-binding winged helix-turn-helix (wHTH) protein